MRTVCFSGYRSGDMLWRFAMAISDQRLMIAVAHRARFTHTIILYSLIKRNTILYVRTVYVQHTSVGMSKILLLLIPKIIKQIGRIGFLIVATMYLLFCRIFDLDRLVTVALQYLLFLRLYCTSVLF